MSTSLALFGSLLRDSLLLPSNDLHIGVGFQRRLQAEYTYSKQRKGIRIPKRGASNHLQDFSDILPRPQAELTGHPESLKFTVCTELMNSGEPPVSPVEPAIGCSSGEFSFSRVALQPYLKLPTSSKLLWNHCMLGIHCSGKSSGGPDHPSDRTLLRRGRTPTIFFAWSGLIAIPISLLWVAINPSSANFGLVVPSLSPDFSFRDS